jgi:tRNA nucleotidyltransferase/poly(A) polymerase
MKYIKKLNELCDDLLYSENINLVENLDTGRAFIYTIESGIVTIFLGSIGSTHGELRGDDELEGDMIIREGRYWSVKENGDDVDLKGFNGIFSFWEYPSKDEWKPFINKFEKVSGLKVWNNNWMVEVESDYYEDRELIKQDKDVPNMMYIDSGLLPVEKYRGNEDRLDELKIMHLQKLEDKRKMKKPENFGSKADKRPLKWKQALLKSENKLNESPDNINFNGENLLSTSKDARPFCFRKDKDSALVGVFGEFHYDMFERYDILETMNYEYPGRIWLDRKVISFWVYPPKNKIKHYITLLENRLLEKIWDNGYVVEIRVDEEGEIYDKEMSDKYIATDKIKSLETKIIQLEDYQGSEDQSLEEYEWHLMRSDDPRRKYRKKTDFFGSKSDKRPLKWKQAILKSENKLMDFKTFKLNESPDDLSDYSVRYDTEGAYPFLILKNGEFFIGEESTTHLDILKEIFYESDYFDEYFYQYFGFERGEEPVDNDDIEDFIIDITSIDGGRIFTKQKVISFWSYPDTKEELYEIVENIEGSLGIEIIDNNYEIEVVDEKGFEDVIPLEDYKKGKDNIEGWKYHLMSINDPRRKDRIKTDMFGSKADKRPLKWKQALLKSENKLFRYYNFNESKKFIDFKLDMPEELYEISKLYKEYGKDLFIVGGAVRDAIQGKVPHDFDLVTNALPEESKQILKDYNVSDEQGKNFGVLRIYTENCPEGYEIATYRKDISLGRDTKGDDDKVEIGKHITIEDDVKRRDLTMNALFYDINKGEIVDLVGGIDDIKNGIIRTVGDPKERFKEDRLRILRVFRFTSRTMGEIDEETSKSIKNDNRLRGIGPKEDVSQERITEEVYKAFDNSKEVENFQYYLDLLSEYDMWDQMFPGVKINKNIEVKTLVLPIIFYDIFSNNNINMIRKKLIELKIPTEMINKMYFLQEYEKSTTKDVYKLAKLKERYHIDDELIKWFIDVNNMDKKFLNAFLEYSDEGFEISGLDLMKQGFKGREIETEKERLEVERFLTDFLKK